MQTERTQLALPDYPLGLLTSTELSYIRLAGWRWYSVTMRWDNPNSPKGYTLSDISALSVRGMISSVREFQAKRPDAFVCAISNSPNYARSSAR